MSDIFEAMLAWFGLKLENRSLPKWFVMTFQVFLYTVFVALVAVSVAGWWYS